MEKNKVSQLLVMNDREVVGILTKQGIALTLGAIDDISKPASSLHVTKAMDETFTVISGALPVGEVNRLLESSGVIVVANGKLVKWITYKEIVKVSRPEGVAGDIMEPPLSC
jgi:predicted transcriptional regulator